MKKLLKKWEPYLPILFLIALCALFFITRIWRLVTIPSGFHSDEAGMAYDAYCLSQYGVDRYLKSFPVYLTNFGEGQSALCAYLTALLFRIFGFHEILIRIPGVFFSFLTFVFGMLLTRKIHPASPYPALWVGGLITICPYFILASRVGLDCNLMLGAICVFLYFFSLALSSNRMIYYVLCGITGGIALYSYVLSYLMLPLFLLLSLIYVIVQKRFSFLNWLGMAIPMGILAFPLILTQIINLFDLPEMTLGILTFTKLDGYRSSELVSFRFDSLLLTMTNLLEGDMWIHNSIPGIPNLYRISIPFLVIGFVFSLYKTVLSILRRQWELRAFLLIWFLSVIYVVCHITPCINQINSIFFVAVFFVVDGIFVASNLLLTLVRKKTLPEKAPLQFLPWLPQGICVVIYFVCFLSFSRYYYLGQYTYDNYPLGYFDIRVTEAIAFLREHPQYGPKGTQMAELPIHFALSTLDSPYDLQLFDPHNLYLYDGAFHCNCLGEIEAGYNYIVRDVYGEYADRLRAAGFLEINYGTYYLFYSE